MELGSTAPEGLNALAAVAEDNEVVGTAVPTWTSDRGRLYVEAKEWAVL